MKLYHLFPDLMNLYGDRGNLLILRQYLSRRELPAEIVPLPPGAVPDLSPGDLLYAGPGTEPALHAALEHLRPLGPVLQEALAAGVPMLFTGNSWLGLGRSLTTARGETLEGLGLLDFQAVESDRRYTGDALARTLGEDAPPETVVGFQNRCDQVQGSVSPLFSMEMGPGNAPGEPGEGLRQGSLLCTHLIGPLLVKNPQLLAWLAALLGARPGPEPDGEARLAYATTLEALRGRQGA